MGCSDVFPLLGKKDPGLLPENAVLFIDQIRSSGLGLETILFSISSYLDTLPSSVKLCETWLSLLGYPDLTVHGPFLDLNPACFDSLLQEAVLCRFQQAYEAAAALNAKKIIYHSGRYPDIYRDDPSWTEQMTAFWQRFLDGKNGGIMVCMENVLDRDPAPLRSVWERVDREDFGICLDIGHVHCFSGLSCRDWIRVLGSSVSHLHLHDNHGSSDQHLALGEGSLPWQEVSESLLAFCFSDHDRPGLSKSGYGMTCTVECAAAEALSHSVTQI